MKLLIAFLKIWFSALAATFIPLLSIAVLVSILTEIKFWEFTNHPAFWIFAVIGFALSSVYFIDNADNM
jgi:hypothetical protein